MTSTAVPALGLLTTPDGVSNPYPLYDQLREVSPVPGYRDWPPGTVPGADEPVTAWALFRYDQVFEATRAVRHTPSLLPSVAATALPA